MSPRPGAALRPLDTALMLDLLDEPIVFHRAYVPVAGGILCTEGRWRAKDGSVQGTTPFRVFIKDGIVRRPPA